jgi:hypothetical protein
MNAKKIHDNKVVMYIDGYLILIGLVIAIAFPYQAGDLILLDFAICVMLGAVSSNIMLKKGRNGFLGTVLGFFLPILGLIICAIIPKKGLGKNEMLCPWCQETIKIGAVICKHCGKDPRVPPEQLSSPKGEQQ